MAGWHHGLNGRECKWTPGVGDGQGGLVCCDSWGRKESETTERLNWCIYMIYIYKVSWQSSWLNHVYVESKLWYEWTYQWNRRASQMVLVVNNPLANAGDIRDVGLIPGSGRSPGGGHGNPLQYSCLGNPMDRGAWHATVHGVSKSQTWLSNFHFQELRINWNKLYTEGGILLCVLKKDRTWTVECKDKGHSNTSASRAKGPVWCIYLCIEGQAVADTEE